MKCLKCGNELREGAKFCNVCGKQVEQMGQAMPNAATPYPIGTPAPEKTANQNKNVGLIVGLIVLVVIAVLGFVAGFYQGFYRLDKSPAPNSGIVSSDADVIGDTYLAEIDEPEEIEEDDEDFFFPSDREYITRYDLQGKSQSEVGYMRNEIYARRGYIFQTEPYKTYFPQKDWYVPNPYFSEADFNEIELANKDFLVAYEREMGWR